MCLDRHAVPIAWERSRRLRCLDITRNQFGRLLEWPLGIVAWPRECARRSVCLPACEVLGMLRRFVCGLLL